MSNSLSEKFWTHLLSNDLEDVFCQDDERIWTYKDLQKQISEYEMASAFAQILPYDPVIIISDFQFNSVALLFVLLQRRCVVTILRSSERGNVKDLLIQNQILYSILLIEGKWEVETHQPKLLVNKLYSLLKQRQHAGLVLFTSGTTGIPKAVVHDFEIFLLHFQKNFRKNRILFVLPWDQIGGIFILFRAVKSRSALITCDNKDIHLIPQRIQKFQITFFPATPSLLAMFAISQPWLNTDLTTLKVIVYGSERPNIRLINKLQHLLPNVKFRQAYGSTETGLIISEADTDPAMIRIDDPNISIDVTGSTLKIKSIMKAVGHIAGNEVQVYSEWFDTRDRFTSIGSKMIIHGRQNEQFNISGRKVVPEEVFEVLTSIPGVLDVRITSEKNLLSGEAIVAEFLLEKPEEDESFRKRVRKFCDKHLDAYKIPSRITIAKTVLFTKSLKK